MKLVGSFHPSQNEVRGFNKDGGDFWIGRLYGEEVRHELRIQLVVPAEGAVIKNMFACFHVHHDAIETMRELDRIGFLKIFEEIQASTFYDVVQCCVRCDIPVVYHNSDNELLSRKVYQLLYENEDSVSEERGRVDKDKTLSHETQLKMARDLKDKGYSNENIAYIMRINESTVRILVKK